MSNIQGLLDKYKEIPEERFFAELFEGKEYEPTLNTKADVVIDVGACAGEFSAYIYEKATKIYAIEPYSGHYKELEENIKEFDLEKIRPFKLALSDYNGEGDLVVATRGGHVLTKGSKSSLTEKVQVKTLASFMKDQGLTRVDILKIDVENAENEIFNSKDFASVADKINFIIGEHLGQVDNLLLSFGFKARAHKQNIIYER